MASALFNGTTVTWDDGASTPVVVSLKIKSWNEDNAERPASDITSSADATRQFVLGLTGERTWSMDVIWEPTTSGTTYDDWQGWLSSCTDGELVFTFNTGGCSDGTTVLTTTAGLKGFSIVGELDEAFILSTTWLIQSITVTTP